MRLICSLLLLGTTVTLIDARAQGPDTATRQGGGFPASPGLLESFLKDTKARHIITRRLGALTGPNGAQATFTAVIASDPSIAGRQAKGIEVELREGSRKALIFLDDDCDDDRRHLDTLEDFRWRLTRLAQRQRTDGMDPVTHVPVRGITAGFFNRPATAPGGRSPWVHVFNAGWYKDGETTGVRLDGDGAAPMLVRFPGATLDQLIRIIQAGREFLSPT